MENYTFVATKEDAGTRIDKYLQEKFPERTRSNLQNLVISNNIKVNDSEINKNYKLKYNDKIDVEIPEPVILDIKPQNIPLDIVYEDNDILIVNKPKGMVVHPAAGNYENTLVNALMYHCKDNLSSINGVIRPGIVHRIDKNTSGLLMVAKNDSAHNHLSKQIKEHSFLREYEAIVYGKLSQPSATLDFPIGRSKTDRKKMKVTSEHSKHAITHYEVIEHLNNFTHVKFKLETGRTHQIRVHMAYIGHPIVGDDVYGPKKIVQRLNGQCLHAKKIGFIHPTTNLWMEFDSPLPSYFSSFLMGLNKI